MCEFCVDHEKLNENLNVIYESVFEFLENCSKTEDHTASIAHELTEIRQKITSMDGRMTVMNDRLTKLEQRRNNPTS